MDRHIGLEGLAQAPTTHAPELTLQTLPLDRPTALRPLYWRGPAEPAEANSPAGLLIPTGATVSFDTYFGAFFEYQWRLYTRLRSLTLRLSLDGECRLRIWRRTPHAGSALLQETPVSGETIIRLPFDTTHFRENGLLWFDLTATRKTARLIAASWCTPDSDPTPIGLGVAICTFNRETELAAVVSRIAAHSPLDAAFIRIIVVNQGRADLLSSAIANDAARLGSRLRVVEQANMGGAGGFTRGLLEALDDPTISHVCFLDDDVALEPDCLLRMAAFFALAHPDLALGGHMLDKVQPTTLYEAGAVLGGDWWPRPLNAGVDLREPAALDRLVDSTAMHYNGWWMFGFPKRLVETVGMPLPCFIRGDDIEFGLRLHENGIFTVPLPGVAIWHEPFYLKIGGWQLYYETRNALICAALHQDFTPHRVARLMLRRLLIQLLTYRYYSAALIIRGIEDFLLGSEVLAWDPRPVHAGLTNLKTLYPQAWTRRERVLAHAALQRPPSQLEIRFEAIRALATNWLKPTRPDAPPTWLHVRDLEWFRVIGTDHLAVETHWDTELPSYNRDRASFRRLLTAGVKAIWRLYRSAPKVRAEFRRQVPALTTVAAWRRYLGLDL